MNERRDGGHPERSPFWFHNTGLFIHRHLLEVGEDYPFNMYRLLKQRKTAMGQKAGKYQNLRNYMYWLRRLGLIEYVRSEPSSNPHLKHPRRYYRLTRKGRERRELFNNPRRHLYRESWEKTH